MPKRVLHIRSSAAMLGAEKVVLELAKRTQEFGYESLILALRSPGESEPTLIEHARQAGIQTKTLLCRGRFDTAVPKLMRDFIRGESIDLLHSHGYKDNFYTLASRSQLPIVASNHLWKRTSTALRFYCWLDSKLIRHFDHVIAVSEPIQQELLQAGVPAEKVSRIPNGIDTTSLQLTSTIEERRAVRSDLGAAPGQLLIGMLSSLTPEKGHRYAIEAFAQLHQRCPNSALAIVGEGREQQALQAMTKALQIDQHVRFLGHRSDVPDILGALDVFLLPSLAEGLPMALLEAMAAGCAVVASDVGDVSTVVRHGETGLLVTAQNIPALVSALVELAADCGLRERLGRDAAQLVEQHFSARQMAHQHCLLYQRLMNTANSTTRSSYLSAFK